LAPSFSGFLAWRVEKTAVGQSRPCQNFTICFAASLQTTTQTLTTLDGQAIRGLTASC